MPPSHKKGEERVHLAMAYNWQEQCTLVNVGQNCGPGLARSLAMWTASTSSLSMKKDEEAH